MAGWSLVASDDDSRVALMRPFGPAQLDGVAVIINGATQQPYCTIQEWIVLIIPLSGVALPASCHFFNWENWPECQVPKNPILPVLLVLEEF